VIEDAVGIRGELIMGVKDDIFEALGLREGAKAIARSKKAREVLAELAQSETGRELAKELAASETARAIAKELAGSETAKAIAKELAKEAAKETLSGAGQMVVGAAKRISDKINTAIKEQQRKIDEERTAAERRRAEERQAREIEDELAALKGQLEDD
jgi:hypothetical protein